MDDILLPYTTWPEADTAERVMILKTTRPAARVLRDQLLALHSYDVPAIVTSPETSSEPLPEVDR